MERVLLWLRRFGTSGAVANARLLSEERQRDEWIVDSLVSRLTVTDPETVAA